MLNLVESMITFTEARKGSLRLKSDTFDLHSMLENLFDQFSLENINNIDLKLDYEHSSPDWIMGDQKKLSLITYQLLNNALTFTSEGSVTLSCSITTSNNQTLLNISVKDTGTGISKASQQEIFEAFNQIDCNTFRMHGGIGIGLTIVKDALKLMNGTLLLESQVNQGSTFTLQLPIQVPSEDEIQQGKKAARKKLLEEKQAMVFQHGLQEIEAQQSIDGRAKVLVVEDNPVNMKLLVKILERFQFQTLSAAHGKEALALLDEHGPVDAILMDCQMPVMDGYEATRQIRKNHHDLPIIAITANVSEHDQKRCYDAGMSDYLPKPISPQIIESALTRWLGENSDA